MEQRFQRIADSIRLPESSRARIRAQIASQPEKQEAFMTQKKKRQLPRLAVAILLLAAALTLTAAGTVIHKWSGFVWTGGMSEAEKKRMLEETLYLTAVEVVGFLGMMTGGIVMSTWGGFRKRSKTLISGLAVFGLIGAAMAVSGHFILYLVLMFLYGIPLTMIQTAVTTMIQENAEESMQGRVFGLLGTMYSGFLPVGMAVFGPLADVIPLPWVMIGSGVVLVLLATCLLMKKKVLFD